MSTSSVPDMNFVLVLFLAAFAANADCASRIVGGTASTIQEYPSIAQLESKNSLAFVWNQVCAATILNDRHLLTAAHCAPVYLIDMMQYRVRVGSNLRKQGTTYNVNRRFVHPTYGRNGYDGNICVLRLNNRMVFSNNIKAAVLPPQGLEMFDTAPVTLAGWGRLSESGSASNTLQQVQIQVVNHRQCVDMYNKMARPIVVTTNMICAGTVSGGKNSCQGDGGGPLYFNRDIVVGIISHGNGCANAAFPGVSTKVSAYTNWIKNIIN